MRNDEPNVEWSAVIARCLAFLCLKNSEHSLGTKLEQAKLLAKLGLPPDDQAALVDSTTASLRELTRLAGKKKGPKKSAKRHGR